jgi:TonB-linked SusC/RagA family outer membrane protein
MYLASPLIPLPKARGTIGAQTWKVMKLTFFLLTAAFLQVSAKGISQTITVSGKDIPLEKVFKEIKKQSDYVVFYNYDLLKEAKPVTIDIKNGNIKEVLDQCLKDQPLTYSIEDKTIVIIKKRVTVNGENNINEPPPPIDITGKVTDKDGNPLEGASVLIKKTGKGTQTDRNGNFELRNVSSDDEIVISYTGYVSKTFKIGNQTNFSVALEISTSKLDDIQVIAYGTTTQRYSVGSVTKVTAEEIEKQPVSNPLAALQGRVPGLIITQTSGVAGAAFNVQLRGRTSLDLSLTRNDPLIVIDGVPFESGVLPSNQLGAAFNNPYASSSSSPGGLSPINSINTQDIQSIEVLKDADATAIYGSRGANGVLLITTKKAKPGKSKLTVSAYSGFSSIAHNVDFLNTQQYLQMRREAFANDGLIPSASSSPDLVVWDTTRYTDFRKLLIGNTAHTADAQASLSGGDSGTQFTLGAGYHRETNVFADNFADERISLRFDVLHAPVSKKWDTRLSVIYSSDKNNLLHTDLTKYLALPPNIKLYNADGSLAWSDGGVTYASLGFSNPLAELQQKYSSLNKNLSANWLSNFYLFKGFTFRLSTGYNSFVTDENSITPKSSIDPNNSTLAFSQFGSSSAVSWIIEPQLEYNTYFADGKLQALLGTTFQERNFNSITINANNYINDLLLYSVAAAGSVTANNNAELYHYNAFFGRINYNWQQKYLIDLSMRRDGSSRFGPGRQFANFEAVGLGWIFSEEGFIKNKLHFLNFGKLRTSYGITGNDQIGNYKYLDLWASVSNPYQGIPGLRPLSLFNPDFEWEENRKFEAALDLSFLKEKLSVSAAYYLHRSSNQLVSYRLPSQTGFTSVVKNLPALVQNSGWEITLDASLLKSKAFSWNTSFNLTIPSNKLLSFPGLSSSSYSSVYIVGKSLTEINKIKFLGVDPSTGLYYYEDYNNDGTISTPGDLQPLGDRDPKFYGGLSNTIHINNWQLDLFLQFTKQTGLNYLGYQYTMPAGFLNNQPKLVLDRWQKQGDVVAVQRYGSSFTSPVFLPSYNLQSSNGVYSDASFIRVKNISLAYNLPDAVLKKFKMQAARFYVLAQNLFTITGYEGADPETQNFYQLPP